MKEKPTLGSPIFGVFRSDRIPKVTKDVSEYLFIQSSNSSQLYFLKLVGLSRKCAIEHTEYWNSKTCLEPRSSLVLIWPVNFGM